MKDPPIPRSGKCVVCGKPRPRVAELNADPFCSSTCAREWHGCQLPKPEKPTKRDSVWLHGVSGYKKHGCRCPVCRGAANLYRKMQRAARASGSTSGVGSQAAPRPTPRAAGTCATGRGASPLTGKILLGTSLQTEEE